jgi:act minimal PKS acyl carrier protein
MEKFALNDLKEIMRLCAGEDESIDLDGDILDLSFNDLGYDSLALLETASHAERQLGIRLPEERLAEVESPRGFLDLVNDQLAQHA